MSLRKPQIKFLEIIDNILNNVTPAKNLNLKEALNKVNQLYPIWTNFEREFMSLSFVIATGVGKTRLMVAFITYLYTKHNIKNFFVVAPETTVYNKLKKDFGDPSNPNKVSIWEMRDNGDDKNKISNNCNYKKLELKLILGINMWKRTLRKTHLCLFIFLCVISPTLGQNLKLTCGICNTKVEVFPRGMAYYYLGVETFERDILKTFPSLFTNATPITCPNCGYTKIDNLTVNPSRKAIIKK